MNGKGDTYPDRYEAVNAFDADVAVKEYDDDTAKDADIAFNI